MAQPDRVADDDVDPPVAVNVADVELPADRGGFATKEPRTGSEFVVIFIIAPVPVRT
jgi:hypothetical protein